MKFEIVFVLGPGRSGTSLVMHLLHIAGVGLSSDLIPADKANPAGYWEDRYVVEIHRDLLDALGCHGMVGAAVPLPADWLNHPAVSAAKGKLKAYLETTMARHDGLWGIKDPRLSLLLPLWQEICVDLDISSRCVLCLRHPTPVANSISIAHRLDAAIGEAVWLNRVAVSLSHMRDEFCLVHYEDLLARPAQVVRDLLAYVQDSPATETSIEPLLTSSNVVRPELNHATQASPPANPLAAKIYRELRGLSGETYVTEKLRDCVNEYLRFCDEQIGWRKCIETLRSEDLQLRAKLKAISERRDQLGGRLKAATQRRGQLRSQLKAVTESCGQLRAQLKAVTDRRDELEKLLLKQTTEEQKLRGKLQTVQSKLNRTESSRAFVLAKYLTDAARSYLAALKLPYRGWRLLFGPGVYEQSLREKQQSTSEKLQSTSEKLQNTREKLSQSDAQRTTLSNGLQFARKEVTLISWSLKVTLVNKFRSNANLSENALRGLPNDFPLGSADLPVKKLSVTDGSRKRVLYLGPSEFREGIWDTRAKYIFPDLFEELHEQADIYMMTGPVPPFAAETLKTLCNRYGITHFEACIQRKVGGRTDVWLSEALQLANVIRPDVVTNIFGAVTVGFAIGMIGYLLPCRSVLRFAGDEIGVRRLLGTYDKEPERLGRELLDHTLSMALVDAIITMSPWELQRIRNIVTDSTKAKICIRGVDLEKFSPKRERNSSGCVRFLYVGRKSLEKGYDLIESAAELVREKRSAIEFVFAGNFPAEEHGNRKYVGFVQSEDLPALYDHADALILPSRAEGFPQAVAEAMAVGIPCILPEEPFSQMFRHEEDVLLTRLDAQSVADTVLRLHSDPALGDRLAQSSLRIARTELDRRRWKGIYRNIILGESCSDAGPDGHDNA